MNELILSAVRSLESLAPAVTGMENISDVRDDLSRASGRGYLLPDEDERLRIRFGHYLIARAELLATINELKPLTVQSSDRELQSQAFLLAYAAAGSLVRAGKFLAGNFSADRFVRRKLDEAEPRFGIERKQLTRVYKSLTSPRNALGLYRASLFLERNREELQQIAGRDPCDRVRELIAKAEEAIDTSIIRYLKARWYYRLYSLRRRRTDSIRRTIFLLFEMSGRMVSELRHRWRAKQVTPEVSEQIRALLKAGDVLITRHKYAASNLFLPGFWPHVALYTGPRRGNLCVLEARKDGVRLRPLEDTLGVDYVAIIRPNLREDQISAAVERALTHEGKHYDFTFDFSRSDRLVCTEVVYRGFDGIGGINFKLTERAGRFTLSAVDLLSMALQEKGFVLQALYGTPECRNRLLTGEKAGMAARQSILH